MRPMASMVMVLAAGWLASAGDVEQGLGERPDTRAMLNGVLGSAHDFSRLGGGPSDACIACHVPHIQGVRPTTQPSTQPSTQPAIEIYRLEGQRRIFVPNRYMPGPTSLLCLGCHDGTVATSTISASHALLAGVREGFKVPERFVWRDHPIGVPYPGNRRGYRPESFVTAGRKIVLPDGRIECISCHDPHNRSSIKGMLVMSNRRSGLCLACHIK